jgi:hypothetical protein
MHDHHAAAGIGQPASGVSDRHDVATAAPGHAAAATSSTNAAWRPTLLIHSLRSPSHNLYAIGPVFTASSQPPT